MNPNSEEKYPVSINLLKLLRRLYTVILQHQVLPRLAYFQSSNSGQNNSITSEVTKKPAQFIWYFHLRIITVATITKRIYLKCIKTRYFKKSLS